MRKYKLLIEPATSPHIMVSYTFLLREDGDITQFVREIALEWSLRYVLFILLHYPLGKAANLMELVDKHVQEKGAICLRFQLECNFVDEAHMAILEFLSLFSLQVATCDTSQDMEHVDVTKFLADEWNEWVGERMSE